VCRCKKNVTCFPTFRLGHLLQNFLLGKRGKNGDTIPKRREGKAAGDEKCEKYTGLLVLERRIEIRDHNAKYFHNLVTCLLLGLNPNKLSMPKQMHMQYEL
jgi:hypothetical protein